MCCRSDWRRVASRACRRAAYIGVSPTTFDDLVREGKMPKPIRIRARTVWDRLQLDEAFVALSDSDANDPWRTRRCEDAA